MMRNVAGTVLALTAFAPALALSQAYPTKPVRVIVPFPAASIPDIIARQVTDRIGTPLGQPVIVENRVGAGGRIAANAVAKAPGDGYTLLLGSASTQAVAPYIVKVLPYDPLKDFTPIANAASSQTGVVVHASLPVHSMQELIDYAKKNPGKISYASNGIGSTQQLRGELIKQAAGIDMVHVPFGGSNELITAIVAGTVQLTFIVPGGVKQHVEAGRVRLIAVGTPKRLPTLPQLPTILETLPTYDPIVDWFGFFGPAAVPRPIVQRLNGEMVKALRTPEVGKAFETQSLLVIASTPEELGEQVKNDLQVYARAVKAAGVVPE